MTFCDSLKLKRLKCAKTFLTGFRKGFFFLNEAITKQYQTAQSFVKPSLIFPKKRKRGKAENTSEHLYMKPLWDQECSNLFLGNVQFPGTPLFMAVCGYFITGVPIYEISQRENAIYEG